MNATTQQIPSSPAQRLADKIRARTNDGRDLIDLLHDIAQGGYDASKSDRITASKFLLDRGFGKCPRQTPVRSQARPEPETRDNNVEPAPYSIRGALREAPSTGSSNPRLVTQAKDALQDSLGPAPSAHRESAQDDSTLTFDPFSIQSSIQDYILEITNDGETLVDSLIEIAYAADDDSTVTPHLRSRADRILIDQLMRTNPALVRDGVCPDCRRKWTTHPGSHDHPEPSGVVDETEEEPFDREVWEEIIAELNQMEEDGLITPDPDAPEVDMSAYMKWTDEEIAPYAAEAAAKLWNDIDLRLERQKQWPEIEERRRKKLAQIYPSHTDSKSPDT